MKISGDKAAAPPGLAVGSHKERDDGIDNQHQDSFKGVAELGAAKAGRIAANQLKGDAEHRAEKAGWVAAEHGAEKAGWVAAEHGAEKAGWVAAEHGAEKAGRLAANQLKADKPAAVDGAADLKVEKAVEGIERATDSVVDEAAALAAADLHGAVGPKGGTAVAGSEIAEDCALDKAGEAGLGADKARRVAANQLKADKAAAGNKRAADPVVDKPPAFAGNKRVVDLGADNAVGPNKKMKTGTGLGRLEITHPATANEMSKTVDPITEALDQSIRDKKLCLVHISGEDESSKRLEKFALFNEHVAELIARCCIFLPLKQDNAAVLHFLHLYPQRSIPSLSIIGLNGVMLWNHCGYISPEELREKVEKAWASLQIQIGIENEADYAYEKGNMDLDLHHPGYDCCRNHENKESGFKVIEDGHKNETKLEESGAEIAGSRTLFMGNIPFTSKHKELEDFFEGIGQISNIRIATHPEGKSKGFAHVEFTTAEAAQKALTLNGKELIGRPVKLDRAADFYVQSRSKGMERVAVHGFRKGIPEAEIRSILQAHFSSCGDIKKIYIPLHNSITNGVGYIDFSNNCSVSQALKLDGLEVAGFKLIVSPIRFSGGLSASLAASMLYAKLGKEFGD